MTSLERARCVIQGKVPDRVPVGLHNFLMAPHGGLIIGPGCALPYETPVDSVKAIIESAEIYGRYS